LVVKEPFSNQIRFANLTQIQHHGRGKEMCHNSSCWW
jgi:hypothetical protein